jgi:hypothetical protein
MKFIAPAKSINNKHKHEYKQSSNSLTNKEEKYNNIKEHYNKPIDLESIDISNQYSTVQEAKLKSGLSKGKLTLRAIPYFFWFIGAFFILSAFLLLVNLLLGINTKEKGDVLILNSNITSNITSTNSNINSINYEKDLLDNNNQTYNNSSKKFIFDSFNEGKWWQYFIVICIFIFGITFFVVAKYETLVMNKEIDNCTITKSYFLFCKSVSISFNISDIESVYAFKTGKVSNTTNSVIYKIGVKFKYEEKSSTIYIFKSLCEKFVIDDVKSIKEFIYESFEDYDNIKEEIRNGIDYL